MATDATLVEIHDIACPRSASAERVWRHRHVDLALGPRLRADQAGMAAAD